MQLSIFAIWRYVVATVLVLSGSVPEAMAYTLPAGLGTAPGVTGSVPQPGWPNFNNGVDLSFAKLKSGAYQLTAKTNSSAPFTFNTSPTSSWNVTGSKSGSKGSFALTANFNSSLAFQNGTVKIEGKIPSYNGPGAIGTVKTATQNLYSANLTSFGFDTSPVGLGFKTNTTTDTGWASQFNTSGSPESVWFYSNNIWQTILTNVALNVGKSTWSINIKNLQAVTTVPVPGAVWLLGSALAGLRLLGRRRDTGMLRA